MSPIIPLELSEADILEAMRALQGYVDITPGAFREIYHSAYTHAMQRLRTSIRAMDIMSTPAHCLDIGQDAVSAAKFLAEKGISGAPVVDADGVVRGVVSEKDFLRRMGLSSHASFMQVVARCLGNPECMVSGMRRLALKDLMTAPPITAAEDITAAEISALFAEKSINRLPICDAGGRPLGIVTRTDLISALCV